MKTWWYYGGGLIAIVLSAQASGVSFMAWRWRDGEWWIPVAMIALTAANVWAYVAKLRRDDVEHRDVVKNMKESYLWVEESRRDVINELCESHGRSRREALRMFRTIAAAAFAGNPDGEAEWLRKVEEETGWDFDELDGYEYEVAEDNARAEERGA